MIDIMNMKILIVDDMENMCKSIRGMLKVLNYGKSFKLAQNGRDAWNILKNEEIDLAIVDWNMPVMKGIELVGMIREDRELRDMPVIMITAESQREIVAEAAESEIDAYILKPLTVKSLGDKVSGVIDKVNDPPPMVTYLKKARDLEEAGDINGAISLAKKAEKAEPSSSKPLREMGYFYFKNEDMEKAEKYLLKAAKMNKIDVFAFHYLGELYLKKGEMDKAGGCFEKAMAISPRHISRGINFGKILVRNKRVNKAKNVFDKAIGLSSEPLQLREEIANFCIEYKVWDYAVTLLGFILKNFPERYDIVTKMGIAYKNLGNHRKAIGFLVDAEKKQQKDIHIKLLLAECYIATDQVLRADDKLKNILKLDPGNPIALEMLKKNI